MEKVSLLHNSRVTILEIPDFGKAVFQAIPAQGARQNSSPPR
jgi:hypothetical protein